MEASKVYTPQSLDLTFDSSSEDKDVNLKDLIGEEDISFNKIEDNDFIVRAIGELDEMEKKILIDRYFNRKTQVAIAEEIQISQMTVSRVEKRIIEKFRKEMKKSIE